MLDMCYEIRQDNFRQRHCNDVLTSYVYSSTASLTRSLAEATNDIQSEPFSRR